MAKKGENDGKYVKGGEVTMDSKVARQMDGVNAGRSDVRDVSKKKRAKKS